MPDWSPTSVPTWQCGFPNFGKSCRKPPFHQHERSEANITQDRNTPSFLRVASGAAAHTQKAIKQLASTTRVVQEELNLSSKKLCRLAAALRYLPHCQPCWSQALRRSPVASAVPVFSGSTPNQSQSQPSEQRVLMPCSHQDLGMWNDDGRLCEDEGFEGNKFSVPFRASATHSIQRVTDTKRGRQLACATCL